MKKNIITLFSFAVIMAFTMPATVYADNTTITNDSESKTATMNVSYTVEPSYTVTIPASVTIGGEATISAEDICIEKGKTLKVTLSGAKAQNEESGLKVSAGDDAANSPVLGYTITKGSDTIVVGSDIISTTAGEPATANLTFTLSGEYTYSGTYAGTITFTVSVE